MLLEKEFVDAKLKTKYGIFNLRVYSDEHHKETFVLYTDNLDVTKPVLVRIHSECLTGDMLGSLHCDCGNQLQKALKIIKEEGGAVIYLRQEGRGIGLFEKMKAYNLQAQGYDTFEANVLLGHPPDARTYEMAKHILDDLNIKEVRLLTNNPSKVSELAKLDIKVMERVPVTIEANEHNKSYLQTKKDKFQHFTKTNTKQYLYQFQVDSPGQVDEIAKFLENKKKDPLLKIGIGIGANFKTLSNEEEISKIEAITNSCKKYPFIIPVLHYSFKESQDPIKEALAIKEKLPFVEQLQVNDLPSIGLNFFSEVSKDFMLHIPLDNENFETIHNEKFRSLIKQKKMFLLLDNSKGQGIEEPLKALKEKIDVLLSYGLNDIILSGGFGPDNLNRYFELRRYYKINFSIDAETKLKTKGKFDTEKIKLYLLQLITF